MICTHEYTSVSISDFDCSRRQRVGERRVHCAGRLHPLRRLGEARVLDHGNGTAATDHSQGGQADGHLGRRRPRLAAAQMRLLHEGHGPDVPLSFTGEDHSVPGGIMIGCAKRVPTFGPSSHGGILSTCFCSIQPR